MLLFSVSRPIFFIIGLVCFLATHIAYIIYLSRYQKSILGFIKASPLLFSVVILYGTLFLSVLWSHLGELLFPVILYTIVITLMMVQALAAAGNMFHGSGKLFIAGAIVFIISDSLLALNKFYKPFEIGDVSVMFTYGIAQLFIVSAAIKNEDHKLGFVAPQKLELS